MCLENGWLEKLILDHPFLFTNELSESVGLLCVIMQFVYCTNVWV